MSAMDNAADGLDLEDLEDRAVFRARLAAEWEHTSLKKLQAEYGVEGTKVVVIRTVADQYLRDRVPVGPSTCPLCSDLRPHTHWRGVGQPQPI